MKKIIGISLSFIVVFVTSCTKKTITNNDSLLGLDYYPTQLGKYVVYEVDSTIYGVLPRDTTVYKYLIKEKLTDNFIDNEGRSAIKLERYVKHFNASKPYDSIAWTIKEVWMINANNKSVQVVEANKRYTKLIFPIEEKASWNGNAGNTESERLYTYNYVDRAEIFKGNLLEKVLMVTQHEYRTLISYENYAEKYAKGIGLVYREIKNIQSQTIVPNMPIENRIESGLVYKQTLVTYGYE